MDKGGNAWLFVPEGKMTIEGYDDTTGAGFNDNYSDILPEIADKINAGSRKENLILVGGENSTLTSGAGDGQDTISNFEFLTVDGG